jgi:hypothetical protein
MSDLDTTISDQQAARFWAIALETGYSRSGVQRLLEASGYEEAENIGRGDYEDLCEMAGDEELAFQYNRDPDTKDLFPSRPESTPPGR